MDKQDHVLWAMARAGYGEMWEDGLREWDMLPSTSIERALWFNIAKAMMRSKEGYEK